MAFPTEVPPATASVVFDVRLRVGRRRLDGAARAGDGAARAPMSRLRGAPRRPGGTAGLVSYRELADELVGVRHATSASPTSSCCR